MLVALVVTAALFTAKGARACSVCFVAEEETRVAFLVTTGLLTLLPLAFAGGVVWWLVKRAREARRYGDEGVRVGASSSR